MPAITTKQCAVLIACRRESAGGLERVLLDRRRFTTRTVGDQQEALALLRAEHFDLALIYADLPDRSAPELCAAIRATRAEMPVVIAGVPDEPPIRDACEKSGAAAVLSRSTTLDAIVDSVATVLGIPVRRPVRMPVVFNVESAEGREALGRAVNLSPGGMSLEVSRHYDPETNLFLRFTLPGDRERVEGQAQVRWSRLRDKDTYSIGVEFTSLSDSHRSRLATFVDRS